MTSLLDRLEVATKRTVAAAGPRYSPAVDPGAPNIEVAELVDAVSALALGSRARDRAGELATELRSTAKDADTTLSRILAGVHSTPSLVAEDLDRLAGVVDAREVPAAMSTLRRHVRLAIGCMERRQREVEARLSPLRHEANPKLDESEQRQRESLQHRARDLQNVWSSLRDVADWILGSQGRLLADRQCALLLGPWGSGKTHFVCDFALAAIADGVPAVAVLANGLSDDLDPLDGVSEATGIGNSGADLAAMLDQEAIRIGRRAIIMIDAINEANRPAWRRQLPRLARTIARYNNIGLVITCRTPFDQAIITQAAADQVVVLHHPGFEDQEFDAQQEYFAHYGLSAPHVPLITPEFSRPLFLRLLCEAVAKLSRRSQHRQLNDVASGQKGMTFVLEYFAKSVGARVEHAHALDALTCWKLMKGQPKRGNLGFAGRMAEHARDYLSPAEAIDEIVAQTGKSRETATAVSAEMVSEGLMAEDMRYVDHRYETVLTFPYQRFADHLIARHLLDRHLNARTEGTVRRSFYADRPLGAVFVVERWGRQYAEPGVAAAIMLEFPERVKRLGIDSELIHYLPRDRRVVGPFVRTFLDGLYWRDSAAFTADTERVVARLLELGTRWITDQTFETLTGLATRPVHPLNGTSLWRRLESLTTSQRDLSWTEYLRGADDRSNIRRLIAWSERSLTKAASDEVAGNEMRVLALALTTTERVLRDECTRSLVWLGESHPGALFDLTLESLTFNDPYVAERLLAASYGVCMRRWSAESSASPLGTAIVDFSRQLVDRVLSSSASNFTWHTLTRSYATGVVELARKIRPHAIPTNVVSGLLPSPQRAPSPFRAVSRIRLRDTTDGDHAIHMDFGNYTMGRLVSGRSNYDMEHAEYRKVRRQVEDRIRRLGYSKESFGEIDREISHSSFRGQEGRQTDRYGKKYSWIAYFEMYGMREALGLLDREWRGRERTSDCDLDPSFPNDPPSWSAPLNDVFESSPTNELQWLERGGVPDHRCLLDRDEVDGARGGWVLLDATIRQEGSDRRQIVSHVVSVLVSTSRAIRLRNEIEAGRNLGRDGLLDSGADYYTFLGEVPWSQHYGSDVRTAAGVPRRSGGRAFDYFDGRRWKPGIPVEPTTRRWAWESYHSQLNQVSGIEFPAPPLADFLNLRSIGGSADLVDRNGDVASLYRVMPGPAFGSHFLYLRRDLLERYMKARGMQMIRAVWGERDLERDFLRGEDFSDELRQRYVNHVNTFRSVDFGGDWISLPSKAPL